MEDWDYDDAHTTQMKREERSKQNRFHTSHGKHPNRLEQTSKCNEGGHQKIRKLLQVSIYVMSIGNRFAIASIGGKILLF